MTNIKERLVDILNYIKNKTSFKPEVALVLGSGLGNFASKINKELEISYKDIPNFPVSTVSGHEGKFIFGTIGNVKVVCMQGRVHYYEGYEPQEVVIPIRIMKMLGCSTLILTNAAGGINDSFNVGDFMQITGHISSFVPSPLRGENIDELNERFPDMSNIYDKSLVKYISNVAKSLDITTKQGVYLQSSGPNYETPEEIKMFEMLGADAVGMSTAIEAMVAKAMGMRVAGISLITNLASGKGSKLSHEEVKKVASQKTEDFERLLLKVIENIK